MFKISIFKKIRLYNISLYCMDETKNLIWYKYILVNVDSSYFTMDDHLNICTRLSMDTLPETTNNLTEI